MAAAALQLGDLVIHNARTYILRGFDPFGVSPCLAFVEDPATGEVTEVPFEELEASEGQTSERPDGTDG